MAEIRNLTRNGETFYPLTHEKAVIGMEDFKDTITTQISQYQPIEITGDVTNAPDEEDITADSNNLLKFKNRNNLYGLGKVILRRGSSFASQVTQANTIYVVQYNFDLESARINIPNGSILLFEGGALSNGTLVCADLYDVRLVYYQDVSEILSSVTLEGNFIHKACDKDLIRQILVDNSSITKDVNDVLSVKANGIQNTHLNGSVVDASSIVLDSNNKISIKDGGVTGNKLNSGIVNTDDLSIVNNKIQLSNRDTTSGMGYIIVRKNIVSGVNTLTQSMISQSNTIYEIRYDFTLGESITIPANCVLKFNGGSFRNGTLKFNKECDIRAGEQQIFYNITIDANSEPYSHEVDVKWWGAKGDGVTDDAAAIQAAVNSIRTLGYDSSNNRRAYSIVLKAKSAKFFNISETILITASHTCSLDWDMIRCTNHNTTALHLQGVSGSVIKILCVEKITDDPEGIYHIGDWNNTQSQGIVAENIYDDTFYIGSINYFTRGFVAWANVYPAAVWNNNFHINRIAAAHEGFIIKTSGSAWANANHLCDCKFHCISSNTSGGTTRVCDIKFECGDKQVMNNPINAWTFERCSSEGAKVVNNLPKATVYIETDANSTWVEDVVFRDLRIEMITAEFNKPQVYVDHKSRHIIFDNPILSGYDRIIAVYTDDATTEANANIVVDKERPSVPYELYFDSPKQYSRLKHYDFAEYINTLGFNYFIKSGEIVPFTMNGDFSYKVKQKSTSTAYTKWYYGGLPSIILDTKKVFDLYFRGLNTNIYLLDSSYRPIYQATVENNISFNKTMYWSAESTDYPRYLYHSGGGSIRIRSNGTPQDVKYILVFMIDLDNANKGTLDIYSSSDSEYPIVKTPVMEKAMLYDAYIMPSALTSSISGYLSAQTIEKDAVFYSVDDDKYYKCYFSGTVANWAIQGTYTSGSDLLTVTSDIDVVKVGQYLALNGGRRKIISVNGNTITLEQAASGSGSGTIYFAPPRFKEINKEIGTTQERPTFVQTGQIYFDTTLAKHIYVTSVGGSEYAPAPTWAALDGSTL